MSMVSNHLLMVSADSLNGKWYKVTLSRSVIRLDKLSLTLDKLSITHLSSTMAVKEKVFQYELFRILEIYRVYSALWMMM